VCLLGREGRKAASARSGCKLEPVELAVDTADLACLTLVPPAHVNHGSLTQPRRTWYCRAGAVPKTWPSNGLTIYAVVSQGESYRTGVGFVCCTRMMRLQDSARLPASRIRTDDVGLGEMQPSVRHETRLLILRNGWLGGRRE
jgi:hypothetical protein